MPAVLLSASVARFGVFRMRDFYTTHFKPLSHFLFPFKSWHCFAGSQLSRGRISKKETNIDFWVKEQKSKTFFLIFFLILFEKKSKNIIKTNRRRTIAIVSVYSGTISLKLVETLTVNNPGLLQHLKLTRLLKLQPKKFKILKSKELQKMEPKNIFCNMKEHNFHNAHELIFYSYILNVNTIKILIHNFGNIKKI